MFGFVVPDDDHSIEHGLELFKRDIRREEYFGKFVHIRVGEDFVRLQLGLMVIELVRVGLFFEQGGLIIGLERGLNIFRFVDEIQHEGISLAFARAVEAAEGLDRLNAIQLFIHVHGVEQGFVKACLIFVRHHKDAIVWSFEGVFDGDTLAANGSGCSRCISHLCRGR